MKLLLGVVSILVAIGVFAYVGLYICLYGGIVDVIQGLQSNPVDANAVAWGAIRAVLFETIGGLAALIPFVIGVYLLGLSSTERVSKRFY